MNKKSKYWIPEEEKAEIIRLYQSGLGSVKISRILGTRSPSSISQVIRSSGIPIRNNSEKSTMYKVNHNAFEIIDTQEKAYWLGFIYADGYVSINNGQHIFGMALAIKDRIVLERLKTFLKSDHKIKTYASSGFSNSEYVRLNITSNKIVTDLIKHGVLEKKTNILMPPYIARDLIPHFIRGYVDGDGCITSHLKAKYRVFAFKVLGTESMLNFIKDFIEENTTIRIKKFYKRKESQIVSSLEVGGNLQVEKILDLIYKDSVIHLERKHAKYIDLKTLNNVVYKRNLIIKEPLIAGNPLSYDHQIALVTDAMAKCNDFGMVKESKIGQSAAKLLEEYYSFIQEERSTTIPKRE